MEKHIVVLESKDKSERLLFLSVYRLRITQLKNLDKIFEFNEHNLYVQKQVLRVQLLLDGGHYAKGFTHSE